MEDAHQQATSSRAEKTPPADEPPMKGLARLKNPESLVRLRDRVQKAAQELDRLHQENRALRERVEQLETRPALDVDGAVLTFDEDSEVLRKKIEGFIAAIDTYLATEDD